MNKKIDILGRKVPILAVMMALLVIGTASAALIVNYATLTGEVTVSNPITVTGDGDPLPSGGIGTITFDEDDKATFTIGNTGATANVNMVTTLMLDQDGPDAEEYLPVEVIDTEGITITYAALDGETYILTGALNGPIPDLTMPVINGENVITVDFDADAGLVTGTYTIQVEINPIV